MTTLGERVLAKRKELGLTLEELAYHSGVSKTYISDIENDRPNATNPGLGLIRRLARGLGIEARELIDVTNPLTYNTSLRIAIKASVTRSQIVQAVRDLIVDAERTFDYRQWSLYDAETFEAAARLIRDGHKEGEEK